ncbi:MAG: asparagine synthase (glutamine-hydrolyzing), partial [Maioricimonas sp. JB049]
GSTGTITPAQLKRMRDTMVHRGPDGAGVWISDDQTVGLGHRRLSIIDLSESAAQPMSTADGSLWITFNGEIYNHAEIRTELIQLGHHSWKTDHSDTEVLLRAFQQWGIDCVERLRGMFAFAVWDARQQELWLVRDRVGIKPLYYSEHNNRFAFASEIKALLADPQQPRKINEEGLFYYLSYLTTPAPHTLFDGINKLPPGTWMKVNRNGERRVHCYWDVWDHTESTAGVSEADIADRLLHELKDAVDLRSVSDVPVGVFLSGGIDSSTNAALFKETADPRTGVVKTFSVGYQGEFSRYRNETEYARQVADGIGAQHHEILLKQEDLLNFLPEMIHLQDEPIGDPVCVPVHYLARLARDNGVTVCQVGEGSDELFWGYEAWRKSLRLQQLLSRSHVPPAVMRMMLAAWRMIPGQDPGHRGDLLSRYAAGKPIFWGSINAFPHEQKMRLFSPELRRRLGGLTAWGPLQPMRERFESSAWERSHLHWMSYVDLNLRLPELLLMRVDKMTMGASLEARVPFLDHKFVEYAMGISQDVKTRDGVLKHILKKAVRGVIPDSIIDRRKQGFGVPVHDWLMDTLGTVARERIDRFCNETGLFDPAAIAELYNARDCQQLWFLLNLAMWWEHHFADADSHTSDLRLVA